MCRGLFFSCSEPQKEKRQSDPEKGQQERKGKYRSTFLSIALILFLLQLNHKSSVLSSSVFHTSRDRARIPAFIWWTMGVQLALSRSLSCSAPHVDLSSNK